VEQRPVLALADRPDGSVVEELAFPAADTSAVAAEAQRPAVVAEAELADSEAVAQLRAAAVEAATGDFAADCSQAAEALHLDAGWAASVQTPAGFAAEPDSVAAADLAATAADSWVAGCWAADSSAAQAAACLEAAEPVFHSAAHQEPRVDDPAAVVRYCPASDFGGPVVGNLVAEPACPSVAHQGQQAGDAAADYCLPVDFDSPVDYPTGD